MQLTSKEKEQVIEKKTMQILHFLNLNRKNSNIVDQLGIVLRLYKYVVQNIDPQSRIGILNQSGTRDEEYQNELYKGVMGNQGEPITNVILFKHLLYMKGFDANIVLTKSKSGEPHLANLVKIGKERFYFDPSLERKIFVEEQNEDPAHMLFCCAALGKDEYSKIYNPVGVLPKKLGAPTAPIPTDVSDESMPRTLIESIGKIIPDVKAKGNLEFDKYAEEDKSFDLSKIAENEKVNDDSEERDGQ